MCGEKRETNKLAMDNIKFRGGGEINLIETYRRSAALALGNCQILCDDFETCVGVQTISSTTIRSSGVT